MAQGLPIASIQALALSTTESANQVQSTYDYLFSSGRLRLFAKGSDSTVRCNLFIQGVQILRRMQVFVGTAGTLSTSDNLVADVPTLGGRVELTFVATTGTPTVDALLTFEGTPLVGRALRAFAGR